MATRKGIRFNITVDGQRVTAITTGEGKGLDSQLKTASGKTTTIRKAENPIIHPKDKKTGQ